jgi:hypothetical protein
VRTFRLVAAAVAALAAFVLPVAAQAKLPSFSDTSLAPNVGFGGAALGDTRAQLKSAFGSGGVCSDFACMYQDTRRSQLGYAQIAFEDGKRGKVSNLSLSVGTDPRTGKPVFRTPLAAIQSSSGIGLGSSQRAVKAAYPGAKGIRGAPDFLSMFDRHRNQTVFTFTNHRLSRILIQDDRPRG